MHHLLPAEPATFSQADYQPLTFGKVWVDLRPVHHTKPAHQQHQQSRVQGLALKPSNSSTSCSLTGLQLLLNEADCIWQA